MIARWLAATAAAVACALAAQAQQLPVEAFARLSAMDSPVISPDGSRIAYLTTAEGKDILAVKRVDTMEVTHVVDTSQVKARRLRWVDDDIVILIVSDAQRVLGAYGQFEFSAPFSVVLSEGGKVAIRQLMLRDHGDPTIGRFRTSTASIVGLRPETGELLIPDLDGGEFNLFAVDPRTDRIRQTARGNVSTLDWVVDDQGQPLLRIDYRERNDRYRIAARRDGDWDVIVDETGAISSMSPAGVGLDGKLVVYARPRETGRMGLYTLSLETGEIDGEVLVDDTYDIGDTMLDPYTNRVIGARIDAEEPKVVWFDPDLAARQAEADGSFPGAAYFVSWSRDRKHIIVAVETYDEPTTYYLFDVETKHARGIGASHPELLGKGLPPRISITYPARDGVRIPAYMTKADDLPQPAPTVIMPHGGPAARDYGGFDYMAQFLASRGYVVLQPNFRGSTGYGDAWSDAGYGQYGGLMQDDVTDGVKALVDAGIADPDRVCIVGQSYGGYAALAGAAFTPELYRCAVSISGVTDLNGMVAFRSRRYAGYDAEDDRERMAGEDAGGGRLAELSPTRNAERVTAAVLLIHGREDAVVPISQSRDMEDALDDAGKDVELVVLKGEDHYLSQAETRLETLEALDSFLAEHLAE